MQTVRLRTGVWYNDREVELSFPDGWELVIQTPQTPAALTPERIRSILAAPVNSPPIREFARGKRHPVIIVDDKSRPTPVGKLMPYLLEEFERAGVPAESIRVLVAAGTHGEQSDTCLRNKLGTQAFERCRVIVHRDTRGCVHLGATSFGSPVYVNRELLSADCIVGVSGIYPQHTTGFGGGAKLALGVLGRQSISHLHFKTAGGDGSYNIDNDFRKNITEMCRMIGLDFICTIHPTPALEISRLTVGSHYSYYEEAAQHSRTAYDCPPPEGADVVIANGYPSDVSYTFMRKGNRPLLLAPPHATRIFVASNPEGLGHHGLYPQGKSSRYLRAKRIVDLAKITPLSGVASKGIRKIASRVTRIVKSPAQQATAFDAKRSSSAKPPSNDLLTIYSPNNAHGPMPPIHNVEVVSDWSRVLERIRADHAGRETLRVNIYTCSSLQCMESQQ